MNIKTIKNIFWCNNAFLYKTLHVSALKVRYQVQKKIKKAFNTNIWHQQKQNPKNVIPNFECRNESITSRLAELSQPQYAHYFV